MKYFTAEEMRPSEQTLHIIRQIAYYYRSIAIKGKEKSYCFN